MKNSFKQEHMEKFVFNTLNGIENLSLIREALADLSDTEVWHHYDL